MNDDALLAEELRDYRTRLDLALAAANTCTWEYEVAGNRLDLDARWSVMLGGPAEPTRTTLAGLAHPDDRPAVAAALRGACSGRVDQYQVEQRIRARDGQWRWIRSVGRVVARDAAGAAVRLIGINSDITEARAADQAERDRLAKTLADQEALLDLRDHESPRLEEYLAKATETAARVLGLDRASVWLFDRECAVLRCVDLFRPNTGRHECGLELSASAHPRYFAALAAREALAAADALHHPDTCELAETYLRPHGVTAMLDVPLRVGRDVRGVLCSERTGGPRPWTIEEEKFAIALASYVLLAIRRDEQRRLTKEFQSTHERLNLALDASSTCTWISDVPTGLVELDENWARMTGRSTGRQKHTMRDLYRRVHPADAPVIRRAVTACVRGGSDHYHIEHRTRRADGSWLWILSRGRVVQRDVAGRVTRMAGTNTDITARKETEAALEQKTSFLHALQQTTLDLLARRNLDELFAALVERATAVFKAVHSDLLLVEEQVLVYRATTRSSPGVVGRRLPFSEDRPCWQARATGRPAVALESGSPPLALAAFPVLVESHCLAVLVLAREETAGFSRRDLEEGELLAQLSALVLHNAGLRAAALREAAERNTALRESEERFRGVFDQSPIAIALLSAPDGRIVEINPAATTVFGYERNEAVGRSSTELGLWVDPTRRDRYLDRLRNETTVPALEAEMRRKDGTVITVLFNGSLVTIGGRAFSLNSIQDITARKRSEAALQASEDRFRVLAEVSPVGIFSSDAAGRCTFVNDRWCELAGLPAAAVLGDGWLAALHPEDRDAVRESWRAAVGTGASSTAELRFLRPDGTILHLVGQSRPQYDSRGTIAGFVGTVTDVTSLRRAEAEREKIAAQLRQAQKMESLGTLAGGIAHDFNNILTGIFGFLDLARHDLTGSHPAQEWLTQTLGAARRAKDLVAQILTFSRHSEASRKPMLLGPVVTEAARLLRSSLPAEVELGVRLDPHAPAVVADSTQIHQTVMNLCTNAWHALPGRGRIEIALEPAEITPDIARAHQGAITGPAARLSVRDNGAGMSAETSERIFEPFFTTKEPGKGTGLGLAVVHGIVTAHSGAISVRSAPGDGTAFELYFPAIRAVSIPTPDASASHDSFAGRGERILWVDDDPLSRVAIDQILRSLGYRVTCSEWPEAALAAFRQTPRAYDLVITDLSMPRLSGSEIAGQIKAIRADVPVLAVTGHIETSQHAGVLQAGVREILLKPLSREQLGAAIRRHLPLARSTH